MLIINLSACTIYVNIKKILKHQMLRKRKNWLVLWGRDNYWYKHFSCNPMLCLIGIELKQGWRVSYLPVNPLWVENDEDDYVLGLPRLNHTGQRRSDERTYTQQQQLSHLVKTWKYQCGTFQISFLVMVATRHFYRVGFCFVCICVYCQQCGYNV